MNIESVVDTFVSSGNLERKNIVNKRPSTEFSRACLEFMTFAAKHSVIQNSRELLVKGLYANVIEGANSDFRDNLMRLTLLYHSAIILGLDAQEEFQIVADNTEGKGKDLIVSYIKRTPDLKTLKCMGYKTTSEPEFDYVWDGFNSDYIHGSKYSEQTDLKLIGTIE